MHDIPMKTEHATCSFYTWDAKDEWHVVHLTAGLPLHVSGGDPCGEGYRFWIDAYEFDGEMVSYIYSVYSGLEDSYGAFYCLLADLEAEVSDGFRIPRWREVKKGESRAS